MDINQRLEQKLRKHKVMLSIALGLFILFCVGVLAAAPAPEQSKKPVSKTQATTVPEPKEAPKKEEPSVPTEYKSALSKAESYAKTMHMSKQGVYDQLVSEYGEKFTPAAAQYAIDNIKADWNANALAKAKDYQNMQHMSPAAIHDQLVSQYGEKFTVAEADYAIQHLDG
jgi:hypothetical protein